MPADFPRSRRVAEQIRQELADILWRDIKDPRVKGVTINAVEVSPDLEHAKVWYTVMVGDRQAVAKGLNSSVGFLRRELAHRMRLRMVPSLAFQYDESVERGAHLSQLIDQAIEEDKQHPHDED